MISDQRHDAQERVISLLRQGIPWREATREEASELRTQPVGDGNPA